MPLWEDARPILVAAYEILRETPSGYIQDGQQLADRFRRRNDDPEWIRDVMALVESGYLEADISYRGGPDIIRGTPRGRQEVEGWPGLRTDIGSAELLMALLERAGKDESLPEDERAKAQGLASAAREAGTALVAKVAAEFAYRATGL